MIPLTLTDDIQHTLLDLDYLTPHLNRQDQPNGTGSHMAPCANHLEKKKGSAAAIS
jgi:hypothetical protein